MSEHDENAKSESGEVKNGPVVQERGRDRLGRATVWEGGRIRYSKSGKSVYVIDKMIDGRDFVKTLQVNSEREALLEYVKFREDPEGYLAGLEVASPIYMTPELVEEYLEYSARGREDNGKQNSQKWIRAKRKMLFWWAERLVDQRGHPLNLRRVSRAKHVLPHLDGVFDKPSGRWLLQPAKGKRHRREAIKAFYGWLRKYLGAIRAVEDPVMDMPVGVGRVAQTIGGRNKVVEPRVVLQVADWLIAKSSRCGHALIVQAATGWHTTEVARFIAGGEILDRVPAHLQEPGVEAVLMGPKHKNGRRHFSKVGERAAFSARILLGPTSSFEEDAPNAAEVVGFSESWYCKTVKAACRELKLPEFSPAWMRHTTATFALERGGYTAEEVGRFLGHADGKMVATVYGPNAVAPKIATVADEGLPAPHPNPGTLESLARRLGELEARITPTSVEAPRQSAKAEISGGGEIRSVKH